MSVALTPPPPLADFSRVDPRAVALLGDRWARQHRVLPLRLDGATIVVATCDPLDCDAEAAVSFATGHRVRWVMAPPAELAREIERWYPEAAARRDTALPPVDVQHLVFGTESSVGGAFGEQGASVIRLVDQLLAEGIAAGASDIHLEPEEQGLAVRHRVDGVLRQVRVLARSVAPALVSRIKILSGLDIADRLRPQDGRARVAVSGAVVDLRVSTLPASHGEKVVVRVLDGSAGLRTLDAIGFADRELRRIRTLLGQREGLILVTGPTGSGKTTTLYAALREVHARGVNIVTVEDPIEYRIPGIVQVQVHERAGLTFSAALRSIMRQDPDVILVGEIRDRETAEIAIQASLTGHLVLSTLHTNDAASAVTRLIDIGVASYQIATAVRGVIAQRLLRRACADCRAAGCAGCGGTGHRGRLAVAEILVMSPELERRIAAGAATESIADSARAGGCVMLWDAGLELVRRGETTIGELRRVAAEPARAVSEPAEARRTRVTIGWHPSVRADPYARLRRELVDAAATLGREVSVRDGDIMTDDGLDGTSAVIVTASPLGSFDGGGPLVVLLADHPSIDAHVVALAGGADVVLEPAIHGRALLAAVLGLLRWRSRSRAAAAGHR